MDGLYGFLMENPPVNGWFGFWIDLGVPKHFRKPPPGQIPGFRQAAEAPDLPVLAVEPNRFTWEKAASEAHDLDLSVSFAADLEEASCVHRQPLTNLWYAKKVDFNKKVGIPPKENDRISVFEHPSCECDKRKCGDSIWHSGRELLFEQKPILINGIKWLWPKYWISVWNRTWLLFLLSFPKRMLSFDPSFI